MPVSYRDHFAWTWYCIGEFCIQHWITNIARHGTFMVCIEVFTVRQEQLYEFSRVEQYVGEKICPTVQTWLLFRVFLTGVILYLFYTLHIRLTHTLPTSLYPFTLPPSHSCHSTPLYKTHSSVRLARQHPTHT